MNRESLIEKAATAKRESKYLDFKRQFDPASASDWCEILKDLVAMANSGGGVIVIGVCNDGICSGCDLQNVRELDPATLTDKLYRYTGEQFSEFEIVDVERDGTRVVAIIVGARAIPLLFTSPGTYEVSPGKQVSAFVKGALYYRHGAKSEPGNNDDLRATWENALEELRRSWAQNIRRVVEAPAGAQVEVAVPSEVRESTSAQAQPIRIVDDPNAPAFRRIDPNQTHPFRQKEVIAEFNRRFANNTINSFDMLCVRRQFRIDESEMFTYKPAFGSRQYSPEFVKWLAEMFAADEEFFATARDLHYASEHAAAS